MGDRRHVPALDGVRGAALVAILAYHANPSWLPGAPLAVTSFFTLSGFLITSLLIREIETTGRVDLRSFWLRRARRLVPGSGAAVVLVAARVAGGWHSVSAGLVGDATAALTWTANWRFIASGSTYSSLFADPSPFQHFWSLAVEEQVYVLLPLATLALLGRGTRSRLWFGALVVAGIALSTYAAATSTDIGGAAYYGTHTRLAEPLVGVLLALLLTRADGFARLTRTWTVVVDVLGVVAIGGLVLLMTTLSVDDARLYDGGLLLGAVLTAVVVLASTQTTVVARVLALRPLAALGTISYAVYLFHWPIFQWLDPDGLHLPRVVITEVAITLALAIASTTLLEQPIRRRRNTGAPVFTAGWANASVAAIAAIVIAATVPFATTSAAGVVDLGAGVDDPVPPPPVVVAAAAAPAPPPAAPSVAAPAGSPSTAPPVTAEPVAPDEAALLTGGETDGGAGDAPPEGDAWSRGDVQDAPQGDDGRLRVAVVGDSLAHNVAGGLTTWAQSRDDVVVYDLSVSFCPLSRGGERRWEAGESFAVNGKCGWWADQWSDRSAAFAAFSPDVVLDVAPFSELLDRKQDDWDDWLRPGDRQYHRFLIDEYSSMFDAMRSMAQPTTRFLTLNAPCGDFGRPRGWRRVSEPDARVAALNRDVYPLLVASSQGDLFSQLCPNGSYQDDLWGIEDARPDGMHLSDDAAAALAQRWLGPLVLQTGGGSALLATPPSSP
jgi:peptidoglycan/LPS O-acetylase OafA/YrhL